MVVLAKHLNVTDGFRVQYYRTPPRPLLPCSPGMIAHKFELKFKFSLESPIKFLTTVILEINYTPFSGLNVNLQSDMCIVRESGTKVSFSQHSKVENLALLLFFPFFCSNLGNTAVSEINHNWYFSLLDTLLDK